MAPVDAATQTEELRMGKRPAACPEDVAGPKRWQTELDRRAAQCVAVSETPVTCYREIWGAPKKRISYLCRLQAPAPEALHREWPLEDGGLWGYVFNYNTNEACFYQLEKGESYSPVGLKATLTSTDWAVLSVLGSSTLNREQPENRLAEGLEQKSGGRRLVSSMVWEGKSTGSGRWYFRASHQATADDAQTTDKFVLEYFNQECGVFQTALSIPLDNWLEVMKENAERLRALYVSCQSHRDIMLVKKTL